MSTSNPRSYQGVPFLLRASIWLEQNRKRRRKSIFQAENLKMVSPSSRVTVAHFENIYNHGVHSGVWITPNVVQETESSDVENALNR